MGITTAALVGETIKGPAFQPIKVSKWGEYVDYFGGRNTKKFKGSQYPKFELSYIAKEYLKASDQLYVCRVLGLSGYNAGPAFLIKGTDGTVIAVLRARAEYGKKSETISCDTVDAESLEFKCDKIELKQYYSANLYKTCGESTIPTEGEGFTVNSLNLGRFTIVAKKGNDTIGEYPVSLNAGDKDYIYNVIGGNAGEGSAAVFVEELYDVMLADAIDKGKITEISQTVAVVKPVDYKPIYVNGNEVKVEGYAVPESELTKKELGKLYLYNSGEATLADSSITPLSIVKVEKNGENAFKYQVLEDGSEAVKLSATTLVDSAETNTYNVVYVKSIKNYVYASGTTVSELANDLSDYHEMYRYASTPWIVSEIKGNPNNIEVKKLFRFHTISDGNFANSQIKISIEGIKPDEGLFDVYIRDFNDTDASPVVLETYRNLTMVPGTSNYIGLRIGTFDGAYEIKSKYVAVEVIENEMTAQCVPAGFLGYPVRDYGTNGNSPYLKYNTIWDPEVKDRRQYFGLSDIVGVDVDVFNYKGKDAYTEDYNKGYTDAFHLDSMLGYFAESATTTVTIDGEEYTGMTWQTVSIDNTLEGSSKIPNISSEANMAGTIYENVRARKFTVYPCGGFDGWDIYRDARTNTDKYKASKYKGIVNQKNGKSIFQKISGKEGLALSGNCITSDYYAYLAGINEFINPTEIEINLFATPGIDYVNNTLLVEDAIDVIESRRDTLYVPTTPDKPWGASDDAAEMFTAAEAAENLESTNIDTYFAATYYPWVKYFDSENSMYINLPATKDVLRNMAEVDDKRFPWIAPAGMERGKVDCTKLHTPSTIEDRDNAYDGRINPLINYSQEGVRVWGNKTMYICDETNPMNRVNTVRCVLYMRKLVNQSSRNLIFDPNDETLADEYRKIIEPILKQIKKDRGITDYKLDISQTPEQMDLHELSCALFVKPTPTLEYIEINYVVTPQGIRFEDIKF
jgi:hypothetical protein